MLFLCHGRLSDFFVPPSSSIVNIRAISSNTLGMCNDSIKFNNISSGTLYQRRRPRRTFASVVARVVVYGWRTEKLILSLGRYKFRVFSSPLVKSHISFLLPPLLFLRQATTLRHYFTWSVPSSWSSCLKTSNIQSI